MADGIIESLRERTACLEKGNRRLRVCLIAGLGLLCGTVLVGAAGSAGAPQDLTVRCLQVVDEQGRIVVKVHGPGGYGGMSFWDANREAGIPQISIGCIGADRGGGTQIFMKNAKGERAVNIVAQDEGRIHTW